MSGLSDPVDAPENLNAYGKEGKTWGRNRRVGDQVSRIYRDQLPRQAERIYNCGVYLEFLHRLENQKHNLNLQRAFLCHVRTCPICQKQATKKRVNQFLKVLEVLFKTSIKPQSVCFSHMEFSLTNCPVDQLRATHKLINRAFNKLLLRKELHCLRGWVRSVEVTYSDNPGPNHAHIHFHMLAMFPRRFYLLQRRLIQIWGECLAVDYEPHCWIKRVQPRQTTKAKHGIPPIMAAALEVLKYMVKEDDMKDHPDWFVEFTKQIKSQKLVTAGGVFRGVFATQIDKEAIKPEEAALWELIRFQYGNQGYIKLNPAKKLEEVRSRGVIAQHRSNWPSYDPKFQAHLKLRYGRVLEDLSISAFRAASGVAS